ncbi:cytochrome c oxidase assembly protein [Paracoccus sp. IB05]|uniref:cytochrome c oxidase assembly protein n=1 Tax=Paracoccus sp. IB05 TaxID=2779367 RepID=UPI0018E909C2|nr:cytochrome c oxidase assembly protein [Paracoccus sp. IB05]MBJ2149786.1 cytochrome c oxidase assembly protein [Paracoccus sp. IB05]
MDETGRPETIPWCGPAPDPAAILGSWNFHPLLVLALIALLIPGIARAQNRVMFCVAWAALVIAFVSPLCALTTALFSARALHHLLLVSFAAPLFALALPLRSMRLSGALAPVSLLLTAGALTLWHLPAVYSAAWDSALVYWLMQAALLLPAWAFWSAVFTPDHRDAGTVLVNAALVGSFAGVMGLIGAVLTFSTRLLYTQHMTGPLAWGIEPLADQQTAGLIMWVPGLVPLALVAGVMARRAWRLGEAA